MLVGRVVRNQVDDHAKLEPVSLSDERIEVLQRTKTGINVAIVCYVIASILLRRCVEGGKPHGVNAQLAQDRKPLGRPRQVT
jgi:hypothetical protein